MQTTEVHFQNFQVNFIYQGYRVKVKVIASHESVCSVWVLNLECLDLVRSFSVCRYILGIYLGQVRMSRSLGQGQVAGTNKHVCISCSRVVCLRLKGNLVL